MQYFLSFSQISCAAGRFCGFNSHNFRRRVATVRETVSRSRVRTYICLFLRCQASNFSQDLPACIARDVLRINASGQRESGAKNLRTTFRGSVSRLDGCRVKTCHQHSRPGIRIFRRRNALESYTRVATRVLGMSWTPD